MLRAPNRGPRGMPPTTSAGPQKTTIAGTLPGLPPTSCPGRIAFHGAPASGPLSRVTLQPLFLARSQACTVAPLLLQPLHKLVGVQGPLALSALVWGQ